MIKKFGLPALVLGALLALYGPAAFAQNNRGGGRSDGGRGNSSGRGYSGGNSYSGGDRNNGARSFSGGGGRSFGGRSFEGYRDRDDRFYRGRGFSFGYYNAPYAYGPGYYDPGYCNPPGYYDRGGYWHAYPGCYADPY